MRKQGGRKRNKALHYNGLVEKAMAKSILGGIDAGGTAFKCAVADGEGHILQKTAIATGQPEATLSACVAWFREQLDAYKGEMAGLGIASFGPVNIDPGSKQYGTILKTPKTGWSNVSLYDYFSRALNVAPVIDTDVNAALGAEVKWGGARRARSAAYVTIGTGIGAGFMEEGRFIGRPVHPEFGHIFLQHHKADKNFSGTCPFHGVCLEGLASATAFAKRYGDPRKLDTKHEGWQIEAFYLAQACLVIAMSFRVEKIILGGGLMQAPHLLGLVQESYVTLTNGYLDMNLEKARALIIAAQLGSEAGLKGGILLGLTGQGQQKGKSHEG
jgi:fructokinase